MASGARATRRQTRAAPVAARALACSTQRHFVGRVGRLRFLLRLLLASAHERPGPHRSRPSGALPAPPAHASSAVSGRSVLCTAYRKPPDVYSRALLSSRCLVLLSRGICSKVCPWISRPAGPGRCCRFQPKSARRDNGFSSSFTIRNALAHSLGELARLYRCVHAEPARYQYPAFLRPNRVTDSDARAAAAQDHGLARTNALRRDSRSRGDRCARRQLPLHGCALVSLLLSLP